MSSVLKWIFLGLGSVRNPKALQGPQEVYDILSKMVDEDCLAGASMNRLNDEGEVRRL
jgi:hypothetical protein